VGLIPEGTPSGAGQPGKPDARLRSHQEPAGRVPRMQSFALPAVWGMAVGPLRPGAAHGPGPRPMPLTPEALEALAEANRQVTVPRLAASSGEAGALLLAERPMMAGRQWRLWWAARPPLSCNCGDAQLRGDLGEAIAAARSPGGGREPPLRIVCGALTSQIPRLLFWVSLHGGPGGSRTWLVIRPGPPASGKPRRRI